MLIVHFSVLNLILDDFVRARPREAGCQRESGTRLKIIRLNKDIYGRF